MAPRFSAVCALRLTSLTSRVLIGMEQVSRARRSARHNHSSRTSQCAGVAWDHMVHRALYLRLACCEGSVMAGEVRQEEARETSRLRSWFMSEVHWPMLRTTRFPGARVPGAYFWTDEMYHGAPGRTHSVVCLTHTVTSLKTEKTCDVERASKAQKGRVSKRIQCRRIQFCAPKTRHLAQRYHSPHRSEAS